jgi:thiamine pyrophosphate-dependent acetolactate synthase large subunit-like protein
MKVYEAVADTLVSAGMRQVFAVMGHGNIDLLGHLTSKRHVPAVHARHEQGAVAMADGYARVSGGLGVAMVTQGPGLSNTATALLTAAKVHSRVLLVCADTPGDDPDNSQYMDQVAFSRATAGAFEHVASPERLGSALAAAFGHLRLGRGPVVLNIPTDVLSAELSAPLRGIDTSVVQSPPLNPSPAAVERAATLLGASAQPVILAGRGAVDANAGAALGALSDTLNAPFLTSLLGGGLNSGHPLSGGTAGPFGKGLGSALLAEADCVYAAGVSLSPWTTSGGRVLAAKNVIQVDSHPEQIAIRYPVTVPVIGDAALTTELITDALRARGASGGWDESLRERIAAYPGREYPPFDDRDGQIDPRRILLALNDALPRSRAVVTDTGSFVHFTLQLIDSFDARRLAPTNNFGAVGQALGTGIGACFAIPGEPVTVICGDGGFMMSLNEFHTAVRYRLPLQVIVMNDQAYTAERRSLVARGWPDTEARHPSPDLAALAEAFGARGRRITTLGDLEQLPDFLKCEDGPILIDVAINGDVVNPVGAHIARGLARSGT